MQVQEDCFALLVWELGKGFVYRSQFFTAHDPSARRSRIRYQRFHVGAAVISLTLLGAVVISHAIHDTSGQIAPEVAQQAQLVCRLCEAYEDVVHYVFRHGQLAR